MSVGDSRHYRIDEIQGRHFIQTAERAGLPATIAQNALEEIANDAEAALTAVEKQLPAGFSEEIPSSVQSGFRSRLSRI